MAIREGAWDCTTCGRTGNRGPEKHCAGCGHPRGQDVEFYLPTDAPEVDERAALDRALAGPDWSCGHCDGDNRADYAHCTGCGAPRGESKQREVVERRTPVSASAARPEPRTRAAARPSKARRKRLGKDYRDRQRSRGCRRPLLVGALLLVALVATIAWCGRTHEATATVTGFAWERTIEIEKLLTVTEEALPSQVPEGARRLDATGGGTRTVTERIQVGTERVKVGVRDLGNGYFEDIYEDRPIYELRRREVPVRAPPAGGMVRYQIERWTTVREVKASGNDRSPEWPVAELGAAEREGARSESLSVLLAGRDGERLRYRPRNEAEWRTFVVGESYRVASTATGTVRSLTR